MVKQLIVYLVSSREEFKKVTWPSKDSVVQKTILVIIISVVVAVYLATLDYLLTRVLELVV